MRALCEQRLRFLDHKIQRIDGLFPRLPQCRCSLKHYVLGAVSALAGVVSSRLGRPKHRGQGYRELGQCHFVLDVSPIPSPIVRRLMTML